MTSTDVTSCRPSTDQASESPSTLQDPTALEETEQEWQTILRTVAVTPSEAESFITSPQLTKACEFGLEIFTKVMENLIRNPNITSSHLFRADVYYDSEKDASFQPEGWEPTSRQDGHENEELSSFIKHMKKEFRPRKMAIEGFKLRRLLVRRLVPRNPDRDHDLVQTCYFFRSKMPRPGNSISSTSSSNRDEQKSLESTGEDTPGFMTDLETEKNLVLYVPHVDAAEAMPWYHPKVKAVGFLHDWASHAENSSHPTTNEDSSDDKKVMPGTVSIHIIPFSNALQDIDTSINIDTTKRMHRTLQNLLQTIVRHGAGQLAGYKKHAHYDRMVEQSALQDTYTRLKQKHAKYILHECWKETTDATKGVFEDLGIAAFLIELWRGMYAPIGDNAPVTAQTAPLEDERLPPFPGFIDIGCGNGVLVYILLAEGYAGWGFDARMRKTWKSFPAHVQQRLERRVLIPSVLSDASGPQDGDTTDEEKVEEAEFSGPIPIHNGIFAKGTFIVSNHADELSPWTPLLAYLSDSPFICIPCCSHDLTGARFRAPASLVKEDELVSKPKPPENTHEGKDLRSNSITRSNLIQTELKLLPVTKSEDATPKAQQPSAYATLTAYIAHLTRAVGYHVEKEVLRIPSTRNMCIVGRRWGLPAGPNRAENEIEGLDGTSETAETSFETKQRQVRGIIQRETQKLPSLVLDLWRARAGRISTPTNGLDSSSKH